MNKELVVTKNFDGTVDIIILNLGRKFSQEQILALPDIKYYTDNGVEVCFCNKSELPDLKKIESRKQLFHDGNNVKVDVAWEKNLMPDQLIKRKHLKKLHDKIREELSKESPDTIKISKFQHEYADHSNIKAGIHNEDSHWAELSLKKLDEKVANGEPDKPIIREKLLGKINQLKQEKGE